MRCHRTSRALRAGGYPRGSASVARAVQGGGASTPAALSCVAAPPVCTAPIYARPRSIQGWKLFLIARGPLSGAQHSLALPTVCPCPVDLATNLRGAWQKRRSLTLPRSGRRSSGRRSALRQVYSSLTVSTRPAPRRRLQAGPPVPPRPRPPPRQRPASLQRARSGVAYPRGAPTTSAAPAQRSDSRSGGGRSGRPSWPRLHRVFQSATLHRCSPVSYFS